MPQHPTIRSADPARPGERGRIRRWFRRPGPGLLAVLLLTALAPIVLPGESAGSAGSNATGATAGQADPTVAEPVGVDVEVDREAITPVAPTSTPASPGSADDPQPRSRDASPADPEAPDDDTGPATTGDAPDTTTRERTDDADDPSDDESADESDAPADAPGDPSEPDGVITVPVDEPVQMMGVTWIGSPGEEIVWRAEIDGVWTEWDEEHDLVDERPDEPGRSGTGLILLDGDGATGLEIRLPDDGLEDPRVELLRWDPETLPDPDATGGAVADAAIEPKVDPATPEVGVAPEPTIRPRSAWTSSGWASSNEDCAGGPQYVKTLRHAVVHHSVNSNTYTVAQVPAIMQAIYVYHTDGRGWCDFAYNYAIDRFGTIWQGRSGDIERVTIGGHSAGFNNESVGVVFLGQHQPGESPAAVQPTTAQLNALQALLAWKLSSNGISPTATVPVVAGDASPKHPPGTTVRLPAVSGHRDVAHTSCPGDHLQSKLPSVRTGAAARIPTAPPPSKTGWWAPFTDSTSFANRQAQDFLGRTATAAERAEVENQLKRTGGGAGPVLWFATRPAVAETADAAVRLHLAWPGRLPTADELTARRDRRRAGASAETVAAEHLDATGAGAVDDETFVSDLHENVTGESIPPDVRSALLARLAAGESRAVILVEYAEDPDHRADTERLVRVLVIYHAMVDKLPDDARREGWLREGPAALAAHLLASPVYHARIR